MPAKKIQPICEKCPHKDIDPIIKEIYNTYVKETFYNCPETCEKVAYCFSSKTGVDWIGFTKWCIDNKIIEEKKDEPARSV